MVNAAISNEYKIATKELKELVNFLPCLCDYLNEAIAVHKLFGEGLIESAGGWYFYVKFHSEVSTRLFSTISFDHFEYIQLSSASYFKLQDDLAISKRKIQDQMLKDSEQLARTKWQKIINSITAPPDYQSEWSAEKSYCELNDQDLALASEWAHAEKDDEFTTAKMLSARTAEKIAGKLYLSLGFEVNDVSIKQLVNQSNNLSDDWKLSDLLLNGEICVDVKNARTPLNSKDTYVEHCVSRFKKDRNDHNVIIAGVLSPYLKLDDIKNPGQISYDSTIKFLGETSLGQIHSLQQRFSRGVLQVSLDGMHFIPRWMFEFPEKFYEQRNQYHAKLLQAALEKIPTLEQCRQNNVNPLPAYLSSGLELPPEWVSDLKDWQVNFYNRIRPRDNTVITMPVLFLAILTHFLDVLTKQKWNNYKPSDYRLLIFADHSKDSHSLPLGIYDPLETIESMIETLSILWDNRNGTDLEAFVLFKFNGTGLLEGKKQAQQKYETILAYCGGFVEGKGKCGNSPLILGKHETCLHCCKLICEKCGHCSTKCSLCADRMKSISAEYDHIPVQADYIDSVDYGQVSPEDDIPF